MPISQFRIFPIIPVKQPDYICYYYISTLTCKFLFLSKKFVRNLLFPAQKLKKSCFSLSQGNKKSENRSHSFHHLSCGRWDLNPHERIAHKILSLARLPVPTLPHTAFLGTFYFSLATSMSISKVLKKVNPFFDIFLFFSNNFNYHYNSAIRLTAT